MILMGVVIWECNTNIFYIFLFAWGLVIESYQRTKYSKAVMSCYMC